MKFAWVWRGTWFLPKSDRKAKGRLYSRKGEIYLEVLTSLEDKQPFTYNSFEFIHGVTHDQKLVTLYKCSESLSSYYDTENSVSIYRIRFVIEKGHFTSESFLFNCIEFYPSNLEEWLNLKPFKRLKGHTNTTIEHITAEKITKSIGPELNLIISFHENVSRESSHKIEISTSAEVKIISEKKLSFDVWFEKLTHFSNLLTLSYTKYCSILSLRLINTEVIEKHSIHVNGEDFGFEDVVEHKVHYNIEKALYKSSDFIHHIKMIFLYDDLEADFENIIGRWFNMQDDIRPVLNLLLENILHSGTFNENNFLNSAHALESFHRRFRKNAVLSPEAHKQRVKRIVQSVDEEYKDWILPRIEHGNEPSLHTRLEEILQEVDGEFLQKALKDKAKFITQFKNSRNYYTHYDERLQKKALKMTDLFYLTRQTDYIVLFLILKETGISAETIDRLFSKQLKMGLLFDEYSF